MPGPTIFAMGGGGFLSEPADAALERYVLDLAEPVEPRICFLPTAQRRFPVLDRPPVSARPESRPYRVERRDGTGAVTAIPVCRLSAPDSGVKAPPPEVAELRELRAARRGGRYGS